MKRLVLAAIAGLALTTAAQAEGDAAKGEQVFKRCAACHAVGPDAKNKVGPQLNGIVGRQMGSVEGYAYSKPLMDKAAEVGTWDEAEISAYITDPSAFLGGRGKMAQKFAKEEDRLNVIAYLKTYAADGSKQ